MATHTVAIDVIDISIPEANHKNIPIINKPNRCYGYNANAKEVRQLIQLSRYNIYEAGTNKSINGNNYYDYFPEEEGGGGGGGVTPEDVQNMIAASIDAAVSSSSTNAIQNKVIKEYVDTGLNSKADTSSLADVATSGDYGDLINPPTVDSSISTTSTNAVQNATITNFVNSSIETATAEFKGTFETKEAMNAVTGNKNDYAFLIVKNADGTVNHYERYKWVTVPIDGSNWVFEYNLNNSSYTAEQWAAINSGIKSTDVSQIETNKSDISNLKNEKVDKIDGKGLSTNDFTDADKDQISTNQTNISSHVGNKNNPHEVTKSQVGLGNVDNTSDLNKPISTATQTALDTKIDTAGSGLSKDGTSLKHSNSVTAKTTQTFAKVAYDGQGHITGSTDATAAQISAIDSGITSTKVSQIDTNTTSINYLKQALDGTMVSRYIDYDKPEMNLIVGDVNRFDVYKMMKRCNVDVDGTIKCYYGDSEYKEDGSNGDVMVYLKKFYYKREILEASSIGDTVGGYHIKKEICSISDYPLGGFKCHPLFENEAGNEVDYVLVSAFEGCVYDVSESEFNLTDAQNVDFTASTGDKLMSVADAKPMSGLSQTGCTRPNCEQIAKNKGTGWHEWNIKLASALQMLHLVEFGPNSQILTGRGVVSCTDMSAYNCASYTGSTVGNSTGNATTTYSEISGEGSSQTYTAGSKNPHTNTGFVSVSYRGIENIWGNIWPFISGMNMWGDGSMRGGQPYICKNFNYAESKNSDNYEGAGFTSIASPGYIKYFGLGKEDYDWLFIGSDTDGSENGMIGDYHWVTANLNGYRIALLGGSWDGGSQAGLFCWFLRSGVGSRRRTIGARVMFVPQNT